MKKRKEKRGKRLLLLPVDEKSKFQIGQSFGDIGIEVEHRDLDLKFSPVPSIQT